MHGKIWISGQDYSFAFWKTSVWSKSNLKKTDVLGFFYFTFSMQIYHFSVIIVRWQTGYLYFSSFGMIIMQIKHILKKWQSFEIVSFYGIWRFKFAIEKSCVISNYQISFLSTSQVWCYLILSYLILSYLILSYNIQFFFTCSSSCCLQREGEGCSPRA